MKQILVILIIIGTQISCQNHSKETPQQSIDKRIEKELATGLRNDTIFLEFRFGMSETEVNQHFKKLVNEKKLYLNASNIYVYEFDFGASELISKGQAIFRIDYFNDRLYKLSLSVKSDELTSNFELLQLCLAKIYDSKYGYSYMTKKSLINDSNQYIWIDGNRMIELGAGIDDVRIFYTDLIAEHEKEKIENIQTIENTKKIKNDI